MKQRAKLLDSEDRFYINLEDVPDTETGVMDRLHWESWKKQLRASGVTDTPKQPGKGGLKMAPPNEPEPDAPAITPGSSRPFDPRPAGLAPIELDLAGESGGGGIVVAAGVGLGLALTAALATAFKGRSRGGHPNRLGRRAM